MPPLPSARPPSKVTFEWKEGVRGKSAVPKRRAIGFVAQEVQTKLPELVRRYLGVAILAMQAGVHTLSLLAVDLPVVALPARRETSHSRRSLGGIHERRISLEMVPLRRRQPCEMRANNYVAKALPL